MNFKLLKIAVIAAAFAPALIAQQRPLLTEDPRVIPEGTVLSELGFGYARRARFPVSGLEGNQYSVLVNGLNVGLGPRAEFQLAGVAHNFLRVSGNGGRWVNDWGDFSLSTKLRLTTEGRVLPVITFRPTIVLPNTNNQKGLGTDGTHFFGNLLFGKTVGRAFIFGNAGLGILDDAVRAAAQQDVLAFGIAASVAASPRFNVMAEWNGVYNPQVNPSPGGESRGQVRVGFQYSKWGMRWDAAATAGTTAQDHKAGIVAGFTKEFRVGR